jgi:hypothetical protein
VKHSLSVLEHKIERHWQVIYKIIGRTVRRDEQIRSFPEWRTPRQRLGIKDIEDCASEPTFTQAIHQRAVVNYLRTGEI